MPQYDYSSNGYYFITICVKEKHKLLGKIVGDGAYDVPHTELSEYGKIAEKYIISSNNVENLTIEHYVIMPDHIHMLVYIDDIDGTSRAPSPTNSKISHMVSTFKRFCNKEYGENIWQRSFHDHVIRDEADYVRHYEYITSNPFVSEETENGPFDGLI